MEHVIAFIICDICFKERKTQLANSSDMIKKEFKQVDISKDYHLICNDCCNNLINMLNHVKQIKDWRKYKHDYEFKDWQ